MRIEAFTGQWRFLSNFWPCKVEFEGLVYPSVEHAYQAAKTVDPVERAQVRNAGSASIAKRLGRRVTQRPDWAETRVEIMHNLVKQKFSDPALLQLLLSTGDAELVEGNEWGDTFWGVCRGQGQNQLGKLLMLVRRERAD